MKSSKNTTHARSAILTIALLQGAPLADVVLPPNVTVLGIEPGMPTEQAVKILLKLKPTTGWIGHQRTTNPAEIAAGINKGNRTHEGGGATFTFAETPAKIEYVGEQTLREIWIAGTGEGTIKSIVVLWTGKIPGPDIKALGTALNAQFGEPAYKGSPTEPDWYDCKTQTGLKISPSSIRLVRCPPEEANDQFNYIASSIPNHTWQNILDLKIDGIGLGTPLKEILQSATVQNSQVWKAFGCTSQPDGRFTKEEILDNMRILAKPSSWEYRDANFRGEKVENNTAGMFGYPLYDPNFQLGLDPAIGDWRAHQIEYRFDYPESNVESIRAALEEVFLPLLGELTCVSKDGTSLRLLWGGLAGPRALLRINPTNTAIEISFPEFKRKLEVINNPPPTPAPDFKPRN